MIHYTETHEWLDADGAEVAIGITDFAAEELGEIVFIELPEVGAEVAAGTELVVIESVKAASEIMAPVSGTVTAVNEELVDNPGAVNEDAQGTWFVRMTVNDPADLEGFLDEDAYRARTGA
ncbi:glycine cleavage system protein GcvH [Tessaracoccus sp. G1721]